MGLLGHVKASGTWVTLPNPPPSSKMSYALTATKRKFHRILDEISSASTTSLPPKTAEDNGPATEASGVDSPSKKRRVTPTARHSFSGKRLPTVPQDILSGRTYASRSATFDQTTVKLVDPPRRVLGFFAPWDQDQFLGRLQTFTHEYFKSKPEAISEAEWAKRGWSCTADETVGCVGGCEARVVIDLKIEDDENEEFSIDGYKARKEMVAQLVQKYEEMIANAHGEDCPWRTRGCNAAIQCLRLYDAPTTLSDIRQRYESLLAVSRELPDSVGTPPDYNVKHILQLTPKSFFEGLPSATDGTDPTIPLNIHVKAFTMSLFGWSVNPSVPDIATCSACFRRVGLWIFRTDREKDRSPIIARLDLVDEHRDYCPWKSARAQNSGRYAAIGEEVPEEVPGWKQLVTVIENAHHLRRENTNIKRVTPPATFFTPVTPSDSPSTRTSVWSEKGVGQDLNADDHQEEPFDSQGETITTVESTPEAQAAEEAKDKARWVKLKMLRKALRLNGSKSGK